MNTINFMYFAYNFNRVQLEQLFEYIGLRQHLMNKLSYHSDRKGNGTYGFLETFMELSRGNKLLALEWIENNYKG